MGSFLFLISLNCCLMLFSPSFCWLEELTYPPAALSCSCWKELAEASMLGRPIPEVCPIGISSSEKGFNLCLFSPWVVEVVRGVSLSLFLLMSSLCGVWRTEVSILDSCLWGTIRTGCCSVTIGASDVCSFCPGCSFSSWWTCCCCWTYACCTYSCSISFSLPLLGAWFVVLTTSWCVVEDEAVAPTWGFGRENTYAGSSKSAILRRFFLALSFSSYFVIGSSSVPLFHFDWFAYCSMWGNPTWS